MNAVLGIRDQQHVRFVNRLPAANRAAVETKAVFEGALFQFADRIADVLPQAGKIGEAKIEHFGVMLRCEFNYRFRIHSLSLNCEVE